MGCAPLLESYQCSVRQVGSLVLVSSVVGREFKKVVNPSPGFPPSARIGVLSLFFPLARTHSLSRCLLRLLLVSVPTFPGDVDLAGGRKVSTALMGATVREVLAFEISLLRGSRD